MTIICKTNILVGFASKEQLDTVAVGNRVTENYSKYKLLFVFFLLIKSSASFFSLKVH